MSSDNIEIHIASWQKERELLAKIRRHIFIEEQNVPEELEWDEHDDSSTHFFVTSGHQVIAVARLKPDGQIGRMGVLPEYRRQGIGSKLLDFVLRLAASKNLARVYLHAQAQAISFYEKHGFIAQGDIFYEANIAHREMLKKIC